MSGRRGWLVTAVIILLVWLVLSFGFRALTGIARLVDSAGWPAMRSPMFTRAIQPRVIWWPGGTGRVRSDLVSTVSTEGCNLLQVDLPTGSIYVYPAGEGEGEARIESDIAASTKAAHDSLKPQLSRTGDGGVLRVWTSPLQGLFASGNMQATYRIWAPPGMELEVTARNGSISVTGWEAPMKISTRNGSIALELDAAPALAATTSNGSIVAKLGRLEKGDYRLTTSNGSVRVLLSPLSAVALDARTGNGSVNLGMPGWVAGDLHTSRAMQATLSGGGATLTLRTTNGNITVEAD